MKTKSRIWVKKYIKYHYIIKKSLIDGFALSFLILSLYNFYLGSKLNTNSEIQSLGLSLVILILLSMILIWLNNVRLTHLSLKVKELTKANTENKR